MSKKPTDPGDWSSASEALFRSSREEYLPSARDRERVRQALAQKLAESSHVPAGSPDAKVAFTLKGGPAVGNLIEIGLGVAVVMAAVFAFMRAGESSERAEPRSDAAESGADRARVAEHSPAPSTSAPHAALPSRDEPLAHALPRAEAPQRARPARRARERTMIPQTSATPSEDPRSLPTAKPTAVAPASPESTKSANASASPARSASESVRASESLATRQSAAEPAETQSRPAERPAIGAAATPAREQSASGSDEAGDPRVELAFVRRIHAALLEAKPQVVLALCAEHQRRWPHGTFVQEREGLRAMASCQSGVSDAAARARTFFARYPRGPLAPRVRDACASQLEAVHETARATPR